MKGMIEKMAEYIISCIGSAHYEMDYMVFGDGGRNMVIIPGISLHPVLLSAHQAAAAYSCFAGTHRIYVFDRKKNMEDGYSVRQMAEDTADAMARLGISGADVFGASQGGMIAQCIAAYHPELVRKLVIGSSLARANEMSKRTIAGWVKLAAAGDAAELNRDVFAKVYSPEYLNRYRAAFLRLEKLGTDEEMRRFRIMAEACLGFDFYGELEKISCPVLVLGSRGDNTTGVEGSEEIARRLGCEIYLYDGFGHAVYDEAPDYRERLAAFFG